MAPFHDMQQLEIDVAPNATVTHPPGLPTGQVLLERDA
jgi:hypothetical protein